MAALLYPPFIRLSWTASSLTTNFGGYKIYRRPARAAVEAWEQIGFITVPAGWSKTTVEAQHTRFIDYEAGWSVTGGQWASGWDYSVTALNSSTLLEQSVSAGLSAQTFTAADTPWITCNAAPYLNCPLRSLGPGSDVLTENTDVAQIVGRDRSVIRRRLELPGRTFKAHAMMHDLFGPDSARHIRFAAMSDKRLTLHRPTGDRLQGSLICNGWSDVDRGRVELDLEMVETAPSSSLANYNWPAGVVLTGGTSYILHADAATLDPTASAFTVIVAGVFADSGSTKYALAKGNIPGTNDGYAIRSTGSANQIAGVIDGATTSVTVTSTSATWFDGNPHVAVLTSSGTAQVLYLDGASSATGSTTHGDVANAIGLTVGGNNGAATNGMSMAPAIAYAVYKRALTSTEAYAASAYLLGWPGYRMPYGPTLFVDLRDDRCWNGTGTAISELSGNTNNGTLTGSPTTRGIPWPLKNLEKF